MDNDIDEKEISHTMNKAQERSQQTSNWQYMNKNMQTLVMKDVSPQEGKTQKGTESGELVGWMTFKWQV